MNTPFPRIPDSISALVLTPTTAAACGGYEGESARASPESGWAPAGGQTTTPGGGAKRAHWAPFWGCGRMTTLASASASRPAERIASSQRSTNETSSGAMNGEEPSTARTACPVRDPRLGGELLRRRARAPLEPLVELLRARDDDLVGGDAVHLDGLAHLHFVPTMTRSGITLRRPLLVRLSQLATQTPVGYRVPSPPSRTRPGATPPPPPGWPAPRRAGSS